MRDNFEIIHLYKNQLLILSVLPCMYIYIYYHNTLVVADFGAVMEGTKIIINKTTTENKQHTTAEVRSLGCISSIKYTFLLCRCDVQKILNSDDNDDNGDGDGEGDDNDNGGNDGTRLQMTIATSYTRKLQII